MNNSDANGFDIKPDRPSGLFTKNAIGLLFDA
jgi:hypothetical protein